MSNDKILFIPKQYAAVVAVLLAIIMTVLDGTIMNVALPTLTEQFDVSPSTSIWIVNAYQLVIAVSLLSFSSLGEIHQYRNVFMIGLVIFTISSFICALCNSFWTLAITRVVQGIGASCVMSVNPALIRLIYPPKILGRGLGINAMIIAISAAAGPSIAGSILSIASWHWLFLINIPVGILAFILGRKLLPSNTIKGKHKFDVTSAIANALTFGLFIFALDGFAHSDKYKLIVIELILFLIIGYFFVKREAKMERPIFPVDLLKIPLFTLSVGTSVASFSAQMIAMISLPFFMQYILRYDPMRIGLVLTAWPLATMVTAPLAGRLVEKINTGVLGGCGMAVFSIGILFLYFIPNDASEFNVIWRIALCGAGFGFFQTPNNVTLVASAPHERSGGASGMLGEARLVGQTLGTTIVAFLFNVFPEGHRAKACLIVALMFAVTASFVSSMRVKVKNINDKQ